MTSEHASLKEWRGGQSSTMPPGSEHAYAWACNQPLDGDWHRPCPHAGALFEFPNTVDNRVIRLVALQAREGDGGLASRLPDLPTSARDAQTVLLPLPSVFFRCSSSPSSWPSSPIKKPNPGTGWPLACSLTSACASTCVHVQCGGVGWGVQLSLILSGGKGVKRPGLLSKRVLVPSCVRHASSPVELPATVGAGR